LSLDEDNEPLFAPTTFPGQDAAVAQAVTYPARMVANQLRETDSLLGRPRWSRRADGTAGVTDVKKFALCPAEYRHHMIHGVKVTPAMVLGSLVDRALVGRRGSRHDGPIEATAAAKDKAAAIVEAVRADPFAMQWITGEHQVEMSYEGPAGILLGTSGIDTLGTYPDGSHWVDDLKATANVEPDWLSRHVQKMHWDVQVTAYHDMCLAAGLVMAHGPGITCVSARAPHLVTRFQLSDGDLDECRKTLALWCEKLRACELADEWPGFAQRTLTLGKDRQLQLEGLDDDEAAEGA
jgi:hypothetical protein